MNEYEIEYKNGTEWIYADRYEKEDGDYVFYTHDREIRRVSANIIKNIRLVLELAK